LLSAAAAGWAITRREREREREREKTHQQTHHKTKEQDKNSVRKPLFMSCFIIDANETRFFL
jgi:hypothetical protein